MADRSQIGTVGGFHVPNYLINSKTGVVPHPLQAGNIYGPVTFNAAGIFRPAATPQLQAEQQAFHAPNVAGYSFPKF
jgi:hypothetical protein